MQRKPNPRRKRRPARQQAERSARREPPSRRAAPSHRPLPPVRTLAEWRRAARDRLRERDPETAAFEADLLARHVLELGAADLALRAGHRLSPVEKRRLSRLLHRRMDGEPLQYVLGTVDFAGVILRIEPGVFIPRPETEGLVEHVLAYLGPDPACTVVDLATGSGAVALALAAARPHLHVWGTDLSPEAVRLARANARLLKLTDRVLFVAGDLAAPLGDLRPEQPVRVVVSNPPYISLEDRARMDAQVLDHEPHAALFAGADGLDVIRRIGPAAAELLPGGGLLALEIGEDGGPRVREFLAGDARWRAVRIEKDLAGRDRYALALRSG